jgi:integrase
LLQFRDVVLPERGLSERREASRSGWRAGGGQAEVAEGPLGHRPLVDECDDLAASAAGTSEDVLAEDAKEQLAPRNARIEGTTRRLGRGRGAGCVAPDVRLEWYTGSVLKVTAFIDTNILMESVGIRQIDSCKLLDADEVVLVVSPVVVDELDDLKQHPQHSRKNRARKASTQVRDILDSGGGVRPGVTMEVAHRELDRLELRDKGLVWDRGDDRIIGCALVHDSVTSGDQVLVGLDNSLLNRVVSRQLRPVRLPEQYKRQDDLDPVEVENRRLKAELVKVKETFPTLVLAFADGSQEMVAAVHTDSPEDLALPYLREWAQAQEAIRDQYPQFRGHFVNRAAEDTVQCREFAKLQGRAEEMRGRAARCQFRVQNTGHHRAQGIRVTIFPLRLALRARLWSGSLDEVLPDRFGAGYKPRDRALTPDELSRLLAELTAPKAAAVAFMVATSANWRECTRAQREDIDPETGWVHLRGTKRQTRDRRFVVAHPALHGLLRYAAEHAPGQGLLFPPWTNVRRDLLDACKRGGIERCSPNDLRRTYGRWMRIAAFPDEIIAPTMGHADTRMLERVYGKLSPEELSQRLLLHVRAAFPDCIANASVGSILAEIPDRLDGLERLTPRNWCPGAESNHRHGDFQSPALPTELPGRNRARTYAVTQLRRQD